MTRARATGAGQSLSWPRWVATAMLAGLVAGTAPAEAAKGKSDPVTEADRTIQTAIGALEAGKADLAVQELTAAITGGKISQSKLARALYYRGLAYRKQGKPAQAIADFTSSLWIKNGLDQQQRSDALANRAAAYRDAGLSDQAEADEKRVAATAASGRATRVAAAAASEPAASGTSSGDGLGGFFSALFGGSSTSEEPVGQGFATSTSPSSDSRSGSRGSQAAPAPRVSAWSTETEPGTASRTAKAPAAARAAARPNVAGWKDSTVVSKASARRAAATPATTGSTGKGSTHVQVAAFRSRQEALSAAVRLKQLGAVQPGKREVEIEEAVMGNMGTLYRVRLGPFGSTSEVQSMCPRLRDAGLDCMIID